MKYLIFLTCFSLGYAKLSYAQDRFIVSKSGYALGYAADLVFKNVGSIVSDKFEIIKDKNMYERTKRLLAALMQNGGSYKFNYLQYKISIIKGSLGEPNAFTSGKTIYVTESLLLLLDDRELTAVMAHELAHTEKSHLLRRIVFTVGSPFLATYRYLTKSGNPRSSEIMAEAMLGTEIEADCIAAKWLMNMNRKGLANHPEDLNLASAKIFGGTGYLNYLDPSDPPVIRYHAIKNKMYEHYCCGL